jgi:hypothetical protein
VIRRLPVVLGALAFASLVGASQAEAGHAHFHFGGGFHVGGGVHVGSSWHFARPAYQPYRWHVSGSIYVGPRYTYYPRPYYVYYPTYVPSYYETTSYYPVAPAYTAPGVTMVAPIRQPLPKLGIGLFAGGSAMGAQDGSTAESDDMGLLARFRLTPGLILEGELGKMSYNVDGVSDVRVDRRMGISALYEIGAYNTWAPYILVGTGVQQASVGGDWSTTQDYGEIGAGLRWALTRNFHLAFDIRAGSRNTVSSSTPETGTISGGMGPATEPGTSARTITPPPASSDQNEDYTRARLSAILYF